MAFLNFNGLKQYNKKIKQYIEEKIKDIEVEKLATKDELATKADKNELFSGDYNDLQNLPVIPDTTNLASKSDLTTHTDNNTIHVTSNEKTKWDSKLDSNALTGYATKTYVTDEVNKATSGITMDLTPYAKKVDVNASLDTKVDKISGKSLISDTEIARLSRISNYDDTNIKSSITNINSELSKKANRSELFSGDYSDLKNKPIIPSLNDYAKTADVNSSLDTKVDKVSGKSLVSDIEIARLARVDNYDDTNIKRSINAKANVSDLTTHTDDASIHITSAERKKWNAKAEMSDIPSLTNYATKTFVTDEIAKSATGGTVDLTGYAKTADVNNSLDTKVDKVAGKSLISDTEIARLKLVDNYDDTDIKNNLKKKANVSDLSAHTDDSSIHVTSAEKIKWNNKADASDIPSLTAYATKTYVSDEIAKAVTSGTVDLTGYAKKIELNAHTDDLRIHVTSSDKNNWNNKANASDFTSHKDNADIHVTADDKDKWNAKLDNTVLA